MSASLSVTPETPETHFSEFSEFGHSGNSGNTLGFRSSELPTEPRSPTSSNFELRPYQQDALKATLEGFQQFSRQLVVLPTGAGKTILFGKVAESFQPGRVLILAHREELLTQACAKVLTATGIVADTEKAELQASLDAPVVVASVQTQARQNRLDRFPRDHFGLIVVDEAHHVLADSYKRILDHFESAKVLGVTATPDRGDQKLLSDYFENVACELG